MQGDVSELQADQRELRGFMKHGRRLGYTAVCLTCEETISADERAHREHGVGAWHEDCDAPRNIHIYQRERDRVARRRRYTEQDSNND